MKTQIKTSIARILIAAAVFTAMPATISAQDYENTPVTVSKEKIRIDGQVCYSHIVIEKQTLYSICKAYNVTAEDIYKYNPGVKENGLKKNSILIIPVAGSLQEAEVNTAAKTGAAQEPVQEQITEEKFEIIKPEDKPQSKSRTTHTVKWFEDIETIAGKYGVTVNELMKANSLTGRKLSKRQKLIIPYPGEFADEETTVTEDRLIAAADSTYAVDSVDTETGKSLFPGLLFPKKEVSMGLLMPLKADGSTSSRQNMDFYSGALLAVYDMAKEGISTDLEVYDVADGKIPSDNAGLNSLDIVIGPVSAGDLQRLNGSDPEIKAVVSPLDQRAGRLADTWQALIQAPTPHSVQYKDLVSWIAEDMRPDNRILVITEKGARQTDAVVEMKAAIDSSGLEYSPLSYSILEGRDVMESMKYLMSETSTNRVYIASESEAFVNDVVRNLNLMVYNKYDVVLYAPSRIRGYETIEVENFHNTSMHVSLAYYIDYDSPAVKDFLLKYRALFNTEPSQFAFQGYDIARYFIGICSKYGDRWMENLDETEQQMLQSTFRFVSQEEGGHVNNGVRRIVYGEGWSVEKIR